MITLAGNQVTRGLRSKHYLLAAYCFFLLFIVLKKFLLEVLISQRYFGLYKATCGTVRLKRLLRRISLGGGKFVCRSIFCLSRDRKVIKSYSLTPQLQKFSRFRTQDLFSVCLECWWPSCLVKLAIRNALPIRGKNLSTLSEHASIRCPALGIAISMFSLLRFASSGLKFCLSAAYRFTSSVYQLAPTLSFSCFWTEAAFHMDKASELLILIREVIISDCFWKKSFVNVL